MTTKFISLVALLMSFKFGFIHNESQIFESFKFSPQMKPRMIVKEVKATVDTEFLPNAKGSMAMANKEELLLRELFLKLLSNEAQQMTTNRLKRQANAELKSGIQDNEKLVRVLTSAAEQQTQAIPQDTNESNRQTSLKGSGNRLTNLINLPVRLQVLANVLSQLNRGVIDSKEKPRSANFDSSFNNDKEFDSLANIPLDAEAFVNVLSQVDLTRNLSTLPNSAIVAGATGVAGDLLGTLLKGDPKKGSKGLLNILLGSPLGEGILRSILGNTLGDLLGSLLRGDGFIGSLLGSEFGENFVTGLLNGLLSGAMELVKNIMDLLGGVFNGLLRGLENSNKPALKASDSSGINPRAISGNHTHALNMTSSNKHVSSLINAPVRIKAFINALSALRQEIIQQMQDPAAIKIQGDNNKISSLINLPADLDLKLNLLSSITENKNQSKVEAGSSASLMPETAALTLGGSAAADTSPDSTVIQGNHNLVSSLLNVVPDINLNLNLLSEITELLKSKSVEENNANEVCFDVPIKQAETSITGDNNKISNTVNIKPKVHIDLNLLSTKEQTSDAKVPLQRVCITRSRKPTTEASTAAANLPVAQTIAQSQVTDPRLIHTKPALMHPAIFNAPVSSNLPAGAIPSSFDSVLKTPSASSLEASAHPSLFNPLVPPNFPVDGSTLSSDSVFKTPSFSPLQTSAHTDIFSPLSSDSILKSPSLTSSKHIPGGRPDVICFDVLVGAPRTAIDANNNPISKLGNLEPKLNVGQHAGPGPAHLTVKRICIPRPPSIYYPEELPQYPIPPDTRCFRRTCTKWQQVLDYNCVNNAHHYPKFTYTRDITRN